MGGRAGGVALGVIEGVGVVRTTVRRVALALPSHVVPSNRIIKCIVHACDRV